MEYRMKNLIERCKDGEKLAKEEVVERLKPLVFASIKKYYFGEEEFKDLFQEGVLKILREIEKFDETKGVPFLGYIKLQLKFFYMEKRKKSRKELSLNNQVGTGEDLLSFIDLLVDETANIEERLLKSEKHLFLGRALQTLTTKQKQIIILYYGKGLNMRRISKMLGLHYQTIVKTKERALEKMKKSFSIY
ncbi:RNA polymerase sigma factor [Crassaminicella profunda]|uniref:RNA polymerase sigma factor n=1 Tax=Crassaminicella profunda TaxID=1286698 RepID=UPI001CA69571|nr:sigma-70 family RNA polymerase sigma factor [Crassaminicella profunda]QZY54330.1 sigma-70 family RNA polymerase sigma factor [Crassaminicella profunda]